MEQCIVSEQNHRNVEFSLYMAFPPGEEKIDYLTNVFKAIGLKHGKY